MVEIAEKARRQREIRSLVRRTPVASQDELVRLLARRGHPVTQATLSRDLKELRIVRAPTEDGYRYQPAGGDAEAGEDLAEARRMKSVATLEVTGIDSNETCVVVRTLTGRAQGVAVWLDSLELDDLLATIAGDDTILVVPRSVRRTANLKERLSGALGL